MLEKLGLTVVVVVEVLHDVLYEIRDFVVGSQLKMASPFVMRLISDWLESPTLRLPSSQ